MRDLAILLIHLIATVRVHASLDGGTPICTIAAADRNVISLDDYQWQPHCRGLYQLPIAA